VRAGSHHLLRVEDSDFSVWDSDIVHILLEFLANGQPKFGWFCLKNSNNFLGGLLAEWESYPSYVNFLQCILSTQGIGWIESWDSASETPALGKWQREPNIDCRNWRKQIFACSRRYEAMLAYGSLGNRNRSRCAKNVISYSFSPWIAFCHFPFDSMKDFCWCPRWTHQKWPLSDLPASWRFLKNRLIAFHKSFNGFPWFGSSASIIQPNFPLCL